MGIFPVPVQANAQGVAIAAYPARPPGKRLTIAQVSVSSDSILVSRALIVLNSLLVAGSANGNSDTADGAPAIDLNPSDNLQVAWSGCTPNANCIAVFFYTERQAS